jgi:hypothetical protein
MQWSKIVVFARTLVEKEVIKLRRCVGLVATELASMLFSALPKEREIDFLLHLKLLWPQLHRSNFITHDSGLEELQPVNEKCCQLNFFAPSLPCSA